MKINIQTAEYRIVCSFAVKLQSNTLLDEMLIVRYTGQRLAAFISEVPALRAISIVTALCSLFVIAPAASCQQTSVFWSKVRYAAGTEALPGAPCPTAQVWHPGWLVVLKLAALKPKLPHSCGDGYLVFCSHNILFVSGKDNPKPGGSTDYCSIDSAQGIAYDSVTALARGQPSGQLGDFSTILGILGTGSAVGSIVQSTNKATAIAAGAGIGAAGVGIFAWYYFHHAKLNYIVVFYNTDSSVAGKERDEVRKANVGGQALLPKGDVAVFQVYNGHNYWNSALILDARTGLQFQYETNTVGSSSSSPSSGGSSKP